MMRLLLDTHVFLWAALTPSRLSVAAREAITDRANEVYISAAVSWEIVIKFPRAKFKIPTNPTTYVPSRVAALGFRPLPITQDHALAVESLPSIHRDPFDRIMIAQAIIEGLTFVTRDARLLTYPVLTIEA
jgi:PIN domain nuclease of toxin-antitoxin system